MYYSIASVRNATLLLKDIDLSEIDSPKVQTEGKISFPTIKRRSRISFECHSDLLMAELMEEFESKG